MVSPITERSFKSYIYTVLAAAVGGFITAVPGAIIGSRLIAANSLGGFEDLVGAIMGMVIGYPVGAVLGILVFSRLFKHPGSIWLAALGAVTGVVAVFGLAEPLNLNFSPDFLFGSFMFLTAALAAAGFHYKKKNRKQKMGV